MKAWRIVLAAYGTSAREAFSGQSGLVVEGRWHSRGRPLDYAAESLSLATLERLVHYKRFDALAAHVVFTLDVPDAQITRRFRVPEGWNDADPLPAAQAVGDEWHRNSISPALLVPSAVSRGEHNLIVNTLHPAWNWDWVIAGPEEFRFDRRIEALIRPSGAKKSKRSR